jgi:hypothetical protein
MSSFARLSASAALAFFLLCMSTFASAQASRTWVSGVGDDANPCSRTAPCKTFAGAISKTAAQGVISVLDPAGFGAVTITKSITIEGDGSIAGILSAGTNAIIINAGPGDRIILRNLYLEGFNTGLNGVRVLAAGSVFLDDVRIERFTQTGIDVSPTTAVDVAIRGGSIVGLTGTGVGIKVQPTATGSASVDVENVGITVAPTGIFVGPRSRVRARNVSVGAVADAAFQADSTVGTPGMAEILISGSSAMESGTGVSANGAEARITLHDSTIANNDRGIVVARNGVVQSFGDNRIFGNGINGQPTAQVSTE